MGTEQRRRGLLATIIVLAIVGIGTVAAQEDPPAPPPTEAPTTTTPTGWWLPVLTATTSGPSTSDTTGPAATTTTTTVPELPADPSAPPDGGTGGQGAVPAPPVEEGDGDGGGDGGGVIPAEARRVMSSIPRTAPNDNHALLEGVAALEAKGMPHDEAMRLVFGSFPILGPARWSDDWYTARWTGSVFRYHLGLDMMAPYGTPVAAPADGTVRVSNSALGGLAVYVVQADGTSYYLAHLSGVADGIATGTAVTLGTVVGYVGDSGNARGGPPHVHFAIHPQGGQAIPPKPIVDQWVAEGAARVVELLGADAVGASATAALVATDLTRQLADGVASGPEGAASPPRSELLWASAVSPNGGAVAVADAAAASLNESVDWEQRGAELRSRQQAWSQSSAQAWRLVAPLVHPALRQVVESRR